MSTAEIAKAKDFLKSFKPNVLKPPRRTTRSCGLADGSAWIGITNLGTDDRIKTRAANRSRRTRRRAIGFIDSEQIVKASKNKDKFGCSKTRCSRHVDREELPHERPPALQREGVQDPPSTRGTGIAPGGFSTTGRRPPSR